MITPRQFQQSINPDSADTLNLVLEDITLFDIASYFKNVMENGDIEEFDGISFIEWSAEDQIQSLKEFGCNLHNYDPYQKSDTPQFREEKIHWF